MKTYYDTHKVTSANASEVLLTVASEQHFPAEGLYVGRLMGNGRQFPGLVDLTEVPGLCFLYDNERDRRRVNNCLERLAWRLVLTVPSHLCDLLIYNGGNPGDTFNTHSRINNYVMNERSERVFFDGNHDYFNILLGQIYNSVLERMSSISCSGKKTLYELNESLGRDARMKYQFIFLSDFPKNLTESSLQKISHIIASGAKAGVYVFMSWDMNANLPNGLTSSSQEMLSKMELLFPSSDRYFFKNSGHDEILNRFEFHIDDEPVNPFDAGKWAEHLNNVIDIVKKNNKPSAIKQDFKTLVETPYEPVISELSVTVGVDVNDKRPITLRFNSKDYIHGFILGQSGSGKSVLINNIITSLILKYSPNDLMLYLMDFKGVEFNRYKGLKHTKAVLVDNSDAQMTLEVLRELLEENRRRVKLWQKEAVSNIDGYNQKYPTKRLPQVLFIADECQVMFKSVTNSTERLIQQEISEILNVIATQGRSQGIHMLLATQQLDETDISGQILKNLTECFLMMSAPSDSDKLVPDSSDLTRKQGIGMTCYYHKQSLEARVQTFYATNDELEDAVAASNTKAGNYLSNGGYYFCGSSQFYLKDIFNQISKAKADCPVAAVGQNIGINSGTTLISLKNDYTENVLIFGANKQEQSIGVALNAIASLIESYRSLSEYCEFIVIDSLDQQNAGYRKVLSAWHSDGLCRIVPRNQSGKVLHDLVSDIQTGIVSPTILAILGSERFIEMKRRMPLMAEVDNKDSSAEMIDGIEMLGFSDISNIDGGDTISAELSEMTFPKALLYILEEGPTKGVHTIIQVDKPQNILFEDYDMSAAEKCRHRVMLKSENKFLQPFRLSHDIDVEVLSDDLEHMRAYYYPDGEEPLLFTPFQMPDESLLN